MIKQFKFFLGETKKSTQFVPVMTCDTDTTYHIPIDLYGRILELAVDLYRENMALFSLIEFNLIDAVNNVGITYYYKIDNITPYLNIPDRIVIEYSIKFPDMEYFCNFKTTERISLHNGI